MMYTLELQHQSVQKDKLGTGWFNGEFKVKAMVKTDNLDEVINEFFKQKHIDCNRYGYPVPPNRSGVVLEVIPRTELKEGVLRLAFNPNTPKRGVGKLLWKTHRKFTLVLTPIFEQPHKLIGFSELTVLTNTWEIE